MPPLNEGFSINLWRTAGMSTVAEISSDGRGITWNSISVKPYDE